MKLDEICNGQLEKQIRDGLAQLIPIVPEGGKPRIYVSASDDGNAYVAVGVDGAHGLDAFGCLSIPDAVAAVVAKINSPEAIAERKRKLESMIAKLQSELNSIPEPITVVPAPEALEA